MKTFIGSLNLASLLFISCSMAVMAGDQDGQLAASDRTQIEAAIGKHWPKAQLAAMQNIGPRNQYQIETIRLVTSKPELFAVVEFKEWLVTESRGQVLTVTCRMRFEWQCGAPLAHDYVHWDSQEQPIYLNVGVDEDVALDAFAYVATMTDMTTDSGAPLLDKKERPIITDISKTGRGDLLVTVTNDNGSKTGRVFIRPRFDSQSSRTFSTVDANSYRNAISD